MGFSCHPINYGNHDNIYFRFEFIFHKIKLIKITLNAFPETGKVYIMKESYKIDKNLFDRNTILKILINKLNKFDYELELLEQTFFKNSEELLTYLNNLKK